MSASEGESRSGSQHSVQRSRRRWHARPLRWLAVIGVCPAVLACSTVEEGPFSEGELEVLRSSFEPMPDVLPPDPSNAWGDDPAAAALGQKLFFDARYSSNGEISCATCHAPETGFQDDRFNTSLGVSFTGRHAPTVINAAYAPPGEANWHFWDGRKDSQWSQALGPPENDVEMGSSRTRVAYLIYDAYRDEYEAIFGAMPALRDAAGDAVFPSDAMPGTDASDPRVVAWNALSAEEQDAITQVYVNFGKAISAYERKIVSRNSRFDRFIEDIQSGLGDSPALTAPEKQGLKLFIGVGACHECHSGANLADGKYHNIGVSQEGMHLPEVDNGRRDGIDGVLADEFNCASKWSDHPDKSSCAVQSLEARAADLGAFRTPTLRDITRTAPYMHTGRLATLEEVIDFYDKGGDETGFVGTRDDNIGRLNLTDAERAQLLLFLKALDGEALPESLLRAP